MREESDGKTVCEENKTSLYVRMNSPDHNCVGEDQANCLREGNDGFCHWVCIPSELIVAYHTDAPHAHISSSSNFPQLTPTPNDLVVERDKKVVDTWNFPNGSHG